MKRKKSERTRNYSLVLYNIDDLNKIIDQPNKIQKYAYIYHDKDFNIDKETGETTPKAPHYHLYIRFYSVARITWLDTLRKKEVFKENVMIEICADPERLILYFMHKLNPEKHQYPETDIKASFDISKITNENETTDHADIFKEIKKISESKSTWEKLFTKYPKLIYSAGSLKTVAELIDKEYLSQRRKAADEMRKIDKILNDYAKYEKLLKRLPDNTLNPFNPIK